MHAVTLNEEGLEVGSHHFDWEEIDAISIRTTANGPFEEDVFWLFETKATFVEVPSAAMQGESLTVLQHRFAAIDNRKIAEAMGSTELRIFRVWHRDSVHTTWLGGKFCERFEQLIARIGGDVSKASPLFERLSSAWQSRERKYHNAEHLAECLYQFDLSASRNDRVELALWFHDAIYFPGARDNEQRSARWLLDECELLRIDASTAKAAADLVLATAHQRNTQLSDEAALMVDIDLSILGSAPLRFLEYEQSIEDEFKHVSNFKFQIGRGKFLSALLAQNQIYRTAFFNERYESVARAQIRSLLKSSRYRMFRWFGVFW